MGRLGRGTLTVERDDILAAAGEKEPEPTPEEQPEVISPRRVARAVKASSLSTLSKLAAAAQGRPVCGVCHDPIFAWQTAERFGASIYHQKCSRFRNVRDADRHPKTEVK